MPGTRMPGTRNLMMCLTAGLLAFGSVAFTGCERKEKVLDIETPLGEIEVERSIDTGEVDVEVNEN